MLRCKAMLSRSRIFLHGHRFQTSQWEQLAWCRSISISLSAKNKFNFINGTVKMSSAKTHPDEFSLWKLCNDMVLSGLLNTLELDIVDR
ncbi:hypothetical protein GBA52_007991 [Prunus armeniaca]|nr:hypothetical protein GBA52_007991 [Prunus armeniaca]